MSQGFTYDIQKPLKHGSPSSFSISFAKHDIDELKYKLEHVRWGPKGGLLPNDDLKKDQGLFPSETLLQDLSSQWVKLDFEKVVQDMNRFDNFLVDIDWCTSLHFVHKRSSRRDAIPIILIHGWPGAFYEFYPVIDRLTEPEKETDPAFHVVVPSLPGFCYSKGPPSRSAGIGDVDGYCRILDTLMYSVLGYKSYVAQGGDWGSVHARALGAKFARPDGVSGCRSVHLNFSPIVPKLAWAVATLPQWVTSSALPYLPGDVGKNLRKMYGFQQGMAYYWIQRYRPAQAAVGLLDSPIGLLGWVSFAWAGNMNATPTFTTEALLSLCTLYFVTRCIGTSFLCYHNNELLTDIHGDPAYRVGPRGGATLGYSDFPKEIINASHSWLKSTGDLRFYAKATSGGHFAAMEEPEIFANHLRLAFSPPVSSHKSWFSSKVPSLAQNLPSASLESLGALSVQINGSLWTPGLPDGGATENLERSSHL